MASLLPKSLTAPLDAAPPLPYALGDQLAAVTQDQPLAKMPQFDAAPTPKTVYAPDPEQQMIDHDTQKLQKVQWNQSHPWGTAENHPGTWGKIAHVLSVAGNIAGNIVAPNVMANIPGTQANMQEQEAGLAHRLDTETQHSAENKQKEASAALQGAEASDEPGKAKSLEGYQDAETRKINDELQQGPALQHLETDQGIFAFNPRTKELTPLTYQGSPLMKPTPDKGLMQSQPVIGPDGKPHTYLLDPKTGKKMADEGVHYERPITINNNQEHKEKGEVLKQFQPALDSAERFNVMTKNYEDAVKNHDQQAMLSLLANHLGMTMGLQKGARLTKDIINEAKDSRPWLQGMAAKFDSNGVLSGVTLTPEQMRQMVDLGRGRFMEDTTKARNEAKYLGSTDDGPERTPTKATINHYIALANGDKQKAKQLAIQDGWSVK